MKDIVLIDKNKISDTDTDFMRIVAAFFVVMIHISYITSVPGIFYSAISRFSVPVFIIISGYYMLEKEAGIRYFLKKSGKLFCLMVAWSGIYYIYANFFAKVPNADSPDFITYLLTEPVHLWYLYAAISLYILTPFLGVFHKNANRQEYFYVLVLCFFFGSLIYILLASGRFSILPTILDKMKFPYLLGFVFLYLAGGYMKKFPINHHRMIYVLAVMGTAISFFGTLWGSKISLSWELFLSFLAPNAIMAGIGFFVFIKHFFSVHPIKNRRISMIIREFSLCTLGIYLLHPLLIVISNDFFEGWSTLAVSPIIGVPLRTFVIYAVSLSIVYIFKKAKSLLLKKAAAK